MTMEDPSLEDAVREYVREHHSRGNSHVKTPHVAKALDENSQRITPVMQDLVRDGTLEVWQDNSNATVYRIHLE